MEPLAGLKVIELSRILTGAAARRGVITILWS